MLGWAAGLALVAQLASAEPKGSLEPVVVTGNPSQQRAEQLPYAIGVVDAEAIERAGPRINLSEALARVPGVAAATRNNYAQDQQISSRGFGARAGFGVRGLRLYTDDIPATAPDGQGQVTHFDLANAERIEVLRGPFSALYGNASGGVISVFSADPSRNALDASADIGSFGLQQYRLSGEAVLGPEWSVRAGATYLDVDGFRPHSAASRKLVSTRLARNADSAQLRVNASWWSQPAQDPLGLTRAQFEADPRQTTPQATQFDTRKDADQAQLGASWHEGGLAVSWYGGTRSVTQWLAIPVAAQASPTHSGGVVDFDRRYAGADLRYTWRWECLDLTAGLAGDLQDEDRRGYENFVGTQLGVTGALRRDEKNQVRAFDQYLQGRMPLLPAWALNLGVRHGQTRFSSEDHYLANGDDSGSLDYSFFTPAAGVVFEPRPAWSFHLSVARGYETPTSNELAYRPDGTTGLNTNLRAQTSRQAELSAKWHGDGASADLAVFYARTDDELVVVTNSGGRSSFGNAGRTGRTGAEAGAHWQWLPQLESRVALTWLDAKYRESFLTCAAVPCTTPTQAVPSGNRLPGVPEFASFVDLAWTPWAPLQVAAEWRARSRVAVNDANADFAAGHGVLGLSARYDLPWSVARLRLGARVDNVLDRTYAGSVIVGEANGRFFEPGAPRSFLLSLSVEPPG